MILIVANSKGGSGGKTTLCKNIHLCLTQMGHTAWGFDTDSQNHFESYLETQHEPEEADFIIYDTVGRMHTQTFDLMKKAQYQKHAVIIPSGTSEDDKQTTLKFLDKVKQYAPSAHTFVVFTNMHHAAKRPTDYDNDYIINSAVICDTVIPRLNKYPNLTTFKDGAIRKLLKEVNAL